MQFRKRISMLLLLVVVLLLSIALVAVFLIQQSTVSSNDLYSMYTEQSYLNVLRHWYNYSDSGELSMFLFFVILFFRPPPPPQDLIFVCTAA
jgi:hypothetical protein